jgi:hypothetical protein
MGSEDRTAEAARKQVLFREVNERIVEISQDMEEISPDVNGDSLDVICECADTECSDILVLTRKEYEAIRRDGNRFPVKPGHENGDVEDVVYRELAYLVVEKLHPGSLIAEALAPRR